MSDRTDISETAMRLMDSIAYGGPLPLRIGPDELASLSEYESNVLERTAKKRGVVVSFDAETQITTIDKSTPNVRFYRSDVITPDWPA